MNTDVKQTAAMVAVLTALEKLVKKQKSVVRGELQDWLFEQHEETDIDSMALKIGKTRVGKAIITKPGVGIYGGGTYDRYAYDSGDGTRTITIDATGLTDEQVDWFIDAARECGTSGTVEFKANDSFKKLLEVKGDHVINKATGEVAEGTYVKPSQFRVTGCDPEPVGEAMSIAAAQNDPLSLMSVAGLLEGAE